MKRIGTIDGLANVLLTDDEWLAIRDDLPPLPTCFLCGKESPWLQSLGYESQYDEEHICPQCLDEGIRLLKAEMDWTAAHPDVTKTTTRYRLIEEGEEGGE